MKKSVSALLVLLVFALLSARAAYLFGGMTLTTVVTATTNSPAFYTNTGYVYLPQVTITNNALSITNAYYGYFRFSIDGGNTYFTNNSPVYIPQTTAATNVVILPQAAPIPVIVEMYAVTNTANTGAIQIGATSP